jgi:hypothetical protein
MFTAFTYFVTLCIGACTGGFACWLFSAEALGEAYAKGRRKAIRDARDIVHDRADVAVYLPPAGMMMLGNSRASLYLDISQALQELE